MLIHKFINWIILYLFLNCHFLSAQQIVVNTATALFEIDIENCSRRFVIPLDVVFYDITYHPNGNLYGITPLGELYEVDQVTGASTLVHTFTLSQSYLTLTTGANNLFYALTGGGLYTYALGDSIELFLGNPSVDPSGDLTFYQGDLYAAVFTDNIVRIDLNDVENPELIVNENIPGLLTGIVLIAEDCETAFLYATTQFNDENSGTPALYLVDPDGRTIEFKCNTLINSFGSATPSEFFGSAPLEVLDITAEYVSCDTLGVVSISVIGGQGELSYQRFIAPPQTTGIFRDLPAGTHEITVYDENGCSITRTVELESPVELVIQSVEVAYPNCLPEAATLAILATGAGPLVYSADGGLTYGTDNELNLSTPGTYEIRVKDRDGCTRFVQTTIDPFEPVIIQGVNVVPPCGESTSTVNIAATSVSQNIRYSLDGQAYQTDSVFIGVTNGVFTVFATDMNGCIDSLVGVNVGAPLAFDLVEVVPTSCGLPNGKISITGTAGQPPYAYSLDGTAFSSVDSFINLSPGNYRLRVSDGNGCIAMPPLVQVASSLPLEINGVRVLPVGCASGLGGLEVRYPDSQPSVTLIVNDSLRGDNGEIGGLPTGRMEVLMVDERGCRLDTSFTLRPEVCPIFLPSAFSPNGDGINDTYRPFVGDNVVAEVLSFQIFERWGGLVFIRTNLLTSDPVLGWDGMMGQQPASPGVFAYVLEVAFANGSSQKFSGGFTLTR